MMLVLFNHVRQGGLDPEGGYPNRVSIHPPVRCPSGPIGQSSCTIIDSPKIIRCTNVMKRDERSFPRRRSSRVLYTDTLKRPRNASHGRGIPRPLVFSSSPRSPTTSTSNTNVDTFQFLAQGREVIASAFDRDFGWDGRSQRGAARAITGAVRMIKRASRLSEIFALAQWVCGRRCAG